MDRMDQLEAGRELDALVAEKVMGWRIKGKDWVDEHGRYQGAVETYWVIADGGPSKGWHPSTDIAAAWLVVEKLGWQYVFRLGNRDDKWWCVLSVEPDWQLSDNCAEAPTAPLAICRAALAAQSRQNAPGSTQTVKDEI